MAVPIVAPGRLVGGRYRLLSQIAGGGMGTVWLGQDELLGRQVAVKQVLPPPNADGGEADRQRDRALREGRIAARLSHAHAISMFDVVVDGGQPWLVMEYLPSRSLATVLSEDGLLRVDQVGQIGAQVADALAATHAAGIVHRDVKPANILIGRGDRIDGLVKITDFGISHASGDVTLTQTGQITGTPAFLAPEVAQGDEPQAPSDVFSLGATLYTCLEGHPPFGMGDNALQLLHRVASGDIIPPRYAGSLTRPLLRMLALQPSDRPTMAEIRDELAQLAAGRDGDPTTVLLARTDIRSTGRARTATLHPAPGVFPAGVSPAGDHTGAAPAVASGSVENGDGDRRRRRLLTPLILGALLLAVLAALAVALFAPALRDRSSGTVAASPASSAPSLSAPASSAPASASASASASSQPPPPSAASSAAPSPSSSAPAATTSAAAPSSPPPPAAGSATEVRNALTNYQALLPDDTQSAYALTGPTLRSRVSYVDYAAFWRQFSAVRLSNVQAQDGSTVATGQLEFVFTDGRRQVEQHRFALVRGSNGQLLVDVDQAG